MVIKFGMQTYPIIGISIDVDDEGKPVDILMKSEDISTLDTIAKKHCVLGYNYEELTEEVYLEGVGWNEEPCGKFCALYGRLEPFTVEF